MESTKKVRKNATPTPATAEDTKRYPEKVFRCQDVSASVWKRERVARGEPVVFRSTTFERSYRDAAGKWNYTRNFDMEDLGSLITVANQVSEYVQSLQYDKAMAEPSRK